MPSPHAQPMQPEMPWTQTASWALPALGLSAITANPMLTALAVASLAALVLLLWRPGEPPVLLFVCGFQWLQSCLRVLQADVLGVEVWRLPDVPRMIEEACAWSLAWSVALGAGIALALRLRSRALRSAATAPAPETFGDLLRLYLVWTALVFGAAPFVPASLRQLMVALATLRWAVLFALLAHALRSRDNMGTATVLFAGELVFGFLSFFSAFRVPIYVLALALPEGRLRLRARHYIAGSAVAALALLLAIVWSAIKTDYRAEISGGVSGQVVRVSAGEQLGILVDQVSALDGEAMDLGVQRLIDRIAYTEYLADTMAFVPRMRVHEDGRVWLAAFRHVLMPRALFPDKASLESDTARAERFTGMRIGHGDRATSISLGAPAESYVDFGVPGMLVPAFLFGIFAGFAYAWAIAGSSALIDRGIAVALILPLATVENGPHKLIGGSLAAFLIALALRPLLRRWLAREAPGARTVPA